MSDDAKEGDSSCGSRGEHEVGDEVEGVGRLWHIMKAGYTVQFAGSSCDMKRAEDGRIIRMEVTMLSGASQLAILR